MIIMQTMDAAKRRSLIESNSLAKVIYSHEHDNAVCIQYHPKGIPGKGSRDRFLLHSTGNSSRFSPWHAAGPDYASYSAGMKRCSDLHLGAPFAA
jgi:hypothetical protein